MKTKEYRIARTPTGDWVFKEKGSRRILANFETDHALCRFYAQRICHGQDTRLAHGCEDGGVSFYETFQKRERIFPIPQLDREYYKIHPSILAQP